MDLTLLLDYVLPPGSLLMKHCNGAWTYYKRYEDFLEDKEDYMSQDPSEDFHCFAERLIKKLMEEEANDEEPLICVDYAIWSNYKPRCVNN